MGMQQFGFTVGRDVFPNVMIEVVSFRSSEANAIMDQLQVEALSWPGAGATPLLHWGLENDKLSTANLASSPLGKPYKPGYTRLSAFQAVRQYINKGHAPVFDNRFTQRLGL